MPQVVVVWALPTASKCLAKASAGSVARSGRRLALHAPVLSVAAVAVTAAAAAPMSRALVVAAVVLKAVQKAAAVDFAQAACQTAR